MLVSVLIIFIICWTPRVVQNFYVGLLEWAAIDPYNLILDRYTMGQLNVAFKIVSYDNSIVNVFIYYLTSK